MTDFVRSDGPSVITACKQIHAQFSTSEDLLQQSFAAITPNAGLNAIAQMDEDGAMHDAQLADTQARAGQWRGPLHGILLTVKDLYNARGMPAHGGTRAPLPDLGDDEALAVRRLRAAGAIIFAKTNMHEIASGISGENPWTGDVKNPYDPARQAGGSSGGSAVAVACGIGLASLGSDTAGSIRVPAAFCGVTGFKPTFGLIPLDGALPLCWSCDHGGPITQDVADAHLLTEILADRALPLRPPAARAPARLGVPRRLLDGWLSQATRVAFEALLAQLRERGVALVDVDWSLDDALTLYGPLRAAEAAYVHRAALASAPEGFAEATRTRLLDGQRVTALAYFEAQRQRAQMRAQIMAALGDVDGLILPSAPLPAPLRGTNMVELERGPTEHRAAFVRLSLPFSFTGLPALALPFAKCEGLPLGAQIVTATGSDARAFEIGLWLEGVIGHL